MKLNIIIFRSTLALIILMTFTAHSTGQIKNFPGSNQLDRYVKDEILVKFKNQTLYSTKMHSIKSRNNINLQEYSKLNMIRVKLSKNQNVKDAVADYKNDPAVEYAQPNYIYRTFAIPNDPSFGQLWALQNTAQTISDEEYPINNPGLSGRDMDLTNAWDIAIGKADHNEYSDFIVAVLDTGVNYEHEDLTDNMWDDGSGNHGYDFINGDNDPMDLNGHGTHVAGTIGAVGNNSTGIVGVCWDVKIMAVRVLDTLGSGTTDSIVTGINYAVSNGAKVINMSFGAYADENDMDTLYSQALDNARTHGVVVITAAGNDGYNFDTGTEDLDSDGDPEKAYPCAFEHDNIICVAALDQDYTLADFTNTGANSVDVGAPGTNILSSFPGTEDIYEDDFNDSGALNWSIFPSTEEIWGYQYLSTSTTNYDLLTFPDDWGVNNYSNASNYTRYVYKNFYSLTNGADAATLSYYICLEIYNYDYLCPFYYTGSSYPYSDTVMPLASYTNITTNGYLFPVTYNISSILEHSNHTLGFYFTNSTMSASGDGAAIAFFTIKTLTLNDNSYRVFNGTSMATPHVTGLAALLFAYNPDFTYTDVVNAIKNSGDNNTYLSGQTTTGKAADAFKALCYINRPEGLQVEVAADE